MNKPNKLKEVLEGYKPIPMKRLFYPRGMKLSEDFVNAFHREYDRLVGEGINPKALVERFGKAMSFHVNEPRKYKLLDEEKARLEEGRAENRAGMTGKEGARKSRRSAKKKLKKAADYHPSTEDDNEKDINSAVEGPHGQQ